MQKIQHELTKAGYNNMQIDLRAHIWYNCTNAGEMTRANLRADFTFIIDVQATDKLGDAY